MENLQKKVDAKKEAIEEAEKSYKDLKKEAKKTGSAAAKYLLYFLNKEGSRLKH